MAAIAIEINLNADPQDVLNYLAWIKTRYPNLRNPNPILDAAFVASHNTAVGAVVAAINTGNGAGYVLANLIIAGICTTPMSANVAATSATISCDEMVGATGYTFQYKAQGSTNWVTVSSANPSTALAGLTASTTYQWQVSAVYPSGISPLIPIQTFTTPVAA